MNALLVLALTSTIVLRSGDLIVVGGPVQRENGVVTFRSDGLLYSLPASEVVAIEGAPPEAQGGRPEGQLSTGAAVRKLAVSEEERKRLIAELEQNHSGTPAQPQKNLESRPAPTPSEQRQQSQEEWSWRRQARAHEEAVVRAKENLQLLESRVEDLRAKIRSLVVLGFRPRQFTYDSTQLERTLRQIPAAELEVTRAERAFAQFREDARRQGVLPGWLR
jgi:hypothetical protein